ncbi:hypothetical protein AAC387_Pa02g4715 [Persea americana]
MSPLPRNRVLDNLDMYWFNTGTEVLYLYGSDFNWNSWPEKVQNSRRGIFSSKGTSLPSDAIDNMDIYWFNTVPKYCMDLISVFCGNVSNKTLPEEIHDFGVSVWRSSNDHTFPVAQEMLGAQ